MADQPKIPTAADLADKGNPVTDVEVKVRAVILASTVAVAHAEWTPDDFKKCYMEIFSFLTGRSNG